MPVAQPQQKSFKNIIITPLHVKGAGSLYFNSIITEFSDSWTQRWSPVNVYGRMDPVSYYSGTGRELTLGFRVVSDDVDESEMNMIKIQKLIQYQYPSYTSLRGANVLKSPPYFRFEFLNLLKSKTEGNTLEGYINGAIQISPGFQTKEQAQFFSMDYKNIYFSDVTITLRMQVLHQGSIGWRSSNFTHKQYPYGTGEADATPAPPQQEPQAAPQEEAEEASKPDTQAVTKEDKVAAKQKKKAAEKKNVRRRRRKRKKKSALGRAKEIFRTAVEVKETADKAFSFFGSDDK